MFEPMHDPGRVERERRIRRWAGQCLRKVRMSEKHAGKVISRAARKGTKLRKYLCPHCHGWHVTSQP